MLSLVWLRVASPLGERMMLVSACGEESAPVSVWPHDLIMAMDSSLPSVSTGCPLDFMTNFVC